MSEDPRLVRLEEQERPSITNKPPLPAVDFAALGRMAPGLPATPDSLPQADVIVICWAEAEWAPLQHVFVGGATPMSYSDRTNGTWPEWKKFAQGVPANGARGLTYWGYYRLVTVGQKRVLLFKSNTHLSEGQSYLEQIVSLLIEHVRPSLILSTGTAGGARTTDPVGTVNIVGAGTLYEKTGSPATWPRYPNTWRPDMSLVNSTAFRAALVPIPATEADLAALVAQFNKNHKTSFSQKELDPLGLILSPRAATVNDLTPAGSLLTATTFVVAITSGSLASFACVEMDDAVIGKVCKTKEVAFGFVRNISDPVQNTELPSAMQGHWGELVYEAYGFYSSYNGAIAAWAVLAA